MKTKLEIKILKEKFITDYCKKKNWDPNKLSPSQLIEVAEQSEYLGYDTNTKSYFR
jgi:hypothetical protein